MSKNILKLLKMTSPFDKKMQEGLYYEQLYHNIKEMLNNSEKSIKEKSVKKNKNKKPNTISKNSKNLNEKPQEIKKTVSEPNVKTVSEPNVKTVSEPSAPNI